MSILERIAANAIHIAGEFSESPGLCFFVMACFSVLTIICVRNIVSGLFEMHRSKSALKKIYKNYSTVQRMLLKHAWLDCIHAKIFCRRLIVLHHCILGFMLIEILMAILCSIWPVLMPIIAWYTLTFVMCLSLPVFLLNFALDRYPFQKWKHEFRFRIYHNSGDHESLW